MHTSHITQATLRIGAGLLFLEHGLQKTFGLLGGYAGTNAPAALMTRFGAAGLMESIGGVLLILGFFTRPTAAILVFEMVIAFVISHMPRGGFPVQNNGELALLYALVFAFLATNGAGPYSVDEYMSASRNRPFRR